MIFLADFVSASVPPAILVGRVCVARTRLRADLRDSSGRQAGVRFLRRLPATVLTTQCHTGRVGNIYFCRIGHTSCCADFLLPDSRPSRWKASYGSNLRRRHAASALIQKCSPRGRHPLNLEALSRIFRAAQSRVNSGT